jgi:hypothetical protein
MSEKPTGGLKAFILKVPDFVSYLDMYAIPLGTGLALMDDGREIVELNGSEKKLFISLILSSLAFPSILSH